MLDRVVGATIPTSMRRFANSRDVMDEPEGSVIG
jgi:hypothetical protein